MHSKQQFPGLVFRMIACAATAAQALAIVLALAVLSMQSAQAQMFKVIHNFTGGGDGGRPDTGLTMDAAGNLYGTTSEGGNLGGNCSNTGCGTVFKLKHSGSSWVLTPLYSFAGGNDGDSPAGRVIIAKDGTVYGTTFFGGGGSGTVFHLTPSPTAPKTALARWNETVIYRFSGGSDGMYPEGDLTFGQSGNIYGTTQYGGNAGWGVIYELVPSGGSWTETVLYSPQIYDDGAYPTGGVVFDSSGNLYAVFTSGGPFWDDKYGLCFPSGCGTVYELDPSGSGGIIAPFTGGEGRNPEGGLIIDSSNNLYGTTSGGGPGGAGTVFELAATTFNLNLLYTFSENGIGPQDKLVMDAIGDLYGTTSSEGVYGHGSVFKLTPSSGGWTYTSLHDFTGGSDGDFPNGNLVFDVNGNLYGTTYWGGTGAWGVVFEITP